MDLIVLKVAPVPKPRMTQSDRWKHRPCVDRYFQFKDELREAWGDRPLPSSFHAIFYLPMPSSWSRKKRETMRWQEHQQKPDTDNLMKALKDALYDRDEKVWDERSTKIWVDGEGSIVILPLPELKLEHEKILAKP